MSFLKKYPDNQVVMTSRFCDAYAGIKGFVPLYILPFDSKQSAVLINLLLAQAAPEAKAKVYECMNMLLRKLKFICSCRFWIRFSKAKAMTMHLFSL